jgi:type IV secretory pathway VirB6-like protein
MTLVTLARTLISFMLAISAIAFLIALSPIFLSFMLFQSTFHLFESWLRYMLSYSLQIIVVFAVIALWVSIIMRFGGFFDMLAKLIFDFKALGVPGALTDPSNTFGICPPNYGMSPFGPTAVCAGGFNPALVPDPATGVITPNADYKALLQPSQIPEQTKFIYFVLFHLISLSLIAYAFNALMRDAPEVAKSIVGPPYQSPLVGGWGSNMSWLGKRAHRGAFSGLDARQPLDKAFGDGKMPGSDFIEKMKPLVETRK